MAVIQSLNKHFIERNGEKRLFIEVSWYSLEQYIWLYSRQAFNYCCSLLQV